MKSKRFLGFAIAGLLVGATVCSAARFEQLNVGELSLDGVKVTRTAAQINTIGTAGYITAAMINSNVVTNVLAAGMSLPAVDYSAATNGAAGNIASGNLALARVTNALATAGSTIGGDIPVATITNALTTGGGSIGGNIPIAAMTNAAGGGLCIVTNLDLNGTTNIITFIGTVQRNQ